ncbi:hypothetical protein OG559_25955 [Micromonospora sp. NBC_01405]|uniref:hypothetical protein n=1 Tax=Micromonospora sp. NBC_01405 TaxID=2903589 RepID=UPI0032442BE5
MISEYQQQLRDRYLAALVMPAPEPWRSPLERSTCIPIGGLLGVGFATDPTNGHDLLMAVSHQGHGLFDAPTGEKIARDYDPDPDLHTPTGPDLSCPGIGPLTGSQVRIAGLFGGGLHTTTDDGWTLDVVAPDWPHHRVLLSDDGGLCAGPAGEHWWHIFHANYSELRAAGFSPSGRTLLIATSSDITLFVRPPSESPK